MKKLLLFPFNGNTREACSTIEAINEVHPTWDLLGFVDDDLQKQGWTLGEYKVLGRRDILSKISKDTYLLAVPGRPENFRNRPHIINSLDIEPERLATIIHPSVSVGLECNIGRNCLLMANVVLTSNVTIHDHVVILPNSVISHEATIQNWTMIGSNVSISGGVDVEVNCYIGTGSKIKNNLKIGAKSLIGIGSVVIRNTPEASIVAGNPARILYET